MLEYNSEILSLLTKRVDSSYLEGYYGGAWGPLKDRFFAITHVPLAGVDYTVFDYYHKKLGSSSSYFIDAEKMRIYLDENTYKYKTEKECIEQGLYQAFMIRFYGMLYEEKWYIHTELSFIGDLENEIIAKERVESFYFNGEGLLWDNSLFRTVKEHEPIQFPDGSISRDIDLEEFSHMPSMVANIKRDRKSSLNKAFSAYMHESVFQNFAAELRIHFPDKVAELIPMYSEEFILIYPESKEHILFFTLVKNKNLELRITYFLYIPATGVFYQWTHPKERIIDHTYNYRTEIIEDLKDISGWDDIDYFNSSCTLDKPDFWNNYVFKKENGGYRYLEEIRFPSGDPQ